MADQTVTLRLSPALLAQVDAFREQLLLQTPGAKLSRSDAVRVLLAAVVKRGETMVTSIEQRALAALSTLQEHGMAEVVVTMAETFAITLQAAELEIAAGPKHGQRTGEQLRRAGLNPAERKQYFQDMMGAHPQCQI